MPLMIKSTGLENYAPGGYARVKVLMIGGPGAGKTRWSSYFPSPIYADCEGGLASVADRTMPYVDITTSQDMLDLLAFLKQECQMPPDRRKYQTVVIDTLDAFLRKVKNEWMEVNKKPAFSGWDAWGFLNARMQLLMTRLLNLDLNVIVLVHYKDKVIRGGEDQPDSHEITPQLQGEIADTVFNDFDLVGWMGTYWEAVAGERVQKRGITFKPTPEKPFLKDRLWVTPPWLEVEFSSHDYEFLHEAIESRLGDIGASQVLGEVPTDNPDADPVAQFVITPGAAGSGALPQSAPREIPLDQMDKPTLMKLCRDRGITTTITGIPIRGNTLKAELLDALLDASEAGVPAKEPAALATMEDSLALRAVAKLANRNRITGTASTLARTEAGVVDTATGEVLVAGDAVESVRESLGATIIEDNPTPVEPEPEPAQPEPAPPVATAGVCAVCGKSLDDENPDVVKLSHIKFRKKLCEIHFAEAKNRR